MKKYLLFALSVCLLSACNSKDNELIPEEGDRVEITASAKSLTIDAVTKAPYLLTEPTADAELEALVISSATSENYASLYSRGTMRFASTAKTPYSGYIEEDAPEEYRRRHYPEDGSDLYFVGLHPSDRWTLPVSGATGDNAKKASFVINGNHDVMYASQVTGSNKVTPALTFNHLLTWLKVSVKASDKAAQDNWGKITGIGLIEAGGEGAHSQITVTLDNAETPTVNTSPYLSPNGDIIPFLIKNTTGYSDRFVSEDGIELTTDYVEAAYAMVQPVTATAGETPTYEYVLKVTSTKFTEGREVSINLLDKETEPAQLTGSTQGKSFDIRLNFTTTEIKATATVIGWGDSAGGANVNVE